MKLWFFESPEKDIIIASFKELKNHPFSQFLFSNKSINRILLFQALMGVFLGLSLVNLAMRKNEILFIKDCSDFGFLIIMLISILVVMFIVVGLPYIYYENLISKNKK